MLSIFFLPEVLSFSIYGIILPLSLYIYKVVRYLEGFHEVQRQDINFLDKIKVQSDSVSGFFEAAKKEQFPLSNPFSHTKEIKMW